MSVRADKITADHSSNVNNLISLLVCADKTTAVHSCNSSPKWSVVKMR